MIESMGRVAAPKGEAPLIDGFEPNGMFGNNRKDCEDLLKDLQGNILESHGREQSRFLFIRFDLRTAAQQQDTRELLGFLANGLKEDAASDARRQRFLEEADRRVLEKARFRITSAWEQHRSRKEFRDLKLAAEKSGNLDIKAADATGLHVGFLLSAAGYRVLGLAEEEIPDDEGFKRGMKHPLTSAYLSDPPVETDWEQPYRENLHAVLLLADDDGNRLDQVTRILTGLIERYGFLVCMEKGQVLRKGATDTTTWLARKNLPSIEHFGFRDGISQPLFFRDEIEEARKRGFGYFLALPMRLELEQCESAKSALEEEAERLEAQYEADSKGPEEKARQVKAMLLRRKEDREHQTSLLEKRIAGIRDFLRETEDRMRDFLAALLDVESEISAVIREFSEPGFDLVALDKLVPKIEAVKKKWDAGLDSLRTQKTAALQKKDAELWQEVVDSHFRLIQEQYQALVTFRQGTPKDGTDQPATGRPGPWQEVAPRKRSRYEDATGNQEALMYEGLRILRTLKARLNVIGRSQWDPSAPLGLVLKKESSGSGYGSFFVFRKLRQDVEAFRKLAENRAARRMSAEGYSPMGEMGAGAAEMTAIREMEEARMVGRTKGGCPLAWGENGSAHRGMADGDYQPPENFNYEQDAQGKKCPFHAHIRTVNPRGSTGNAYDERSRRIVRRGVPYAEGKEKGLLFLCAQSNIREQFEYMQKLWANNPDFPPHAYPSSGLDPLIGQRRVAPPSASGVRGYGHAAPAEDYRVVTLKGGEYFFAPSLAFLKRLATSGIETA